MNKFFLFLAFSVFALLACSEDKPPPSHSELCAKATITKECLVGRWTLERVEPTNSNCVPEPNPDGLKLEANGRYSFNGGYGSYTNMVRYGNWELDEKGTTMRITYDPGGDYESVIDETSATIEVRKIKDDWELKIITFDYSSFLQCGPGRYTEVFYYQRAN